MTRPAFPRLSAALALTAALGGCASFPEWDGRPTTAIPAAALSAPMLAEPRLSFADFGDAGLRRMLDEADLNGLDIAAARGRARAADLVVAAAAAGGAPQMTASGGLEREGLSSSLSVSFDPDLSGRLDAQLSAARLEAQAGEVEVMIARRVLAREVTTGWVALAEARTAAGRAGDREALAAREVAVVRARLAGGEIVGTQLSEALARQSAARQSAAGASAQIALAGARLTALGVRTLPDHASLRHAALPGVPAQTDLTSLDARPEVCAAWLRFHAADAARAETLRASRPRLAATGSLSGAAKTLAGLVSGNPLAVAASLSLDGAILDGGQARNRLDQARLAVAQAEIAWAQARSRAEITTLEAAVELIGARDALDAAREAYAVADAERGRARARAAAGVEDGGSRLSAEIAVLDAKIAVDAARARAFRAAAAWQDATAAVPSACMPLSASARAAHNPVKETRS